MKKGLLIVLEGPDGSGKTTQIKLLEKYFTSRNKEVICTREPGGTNISEAIRNIILDNGNSEMGGMCEALLYAAARAQLVKEVIKPALSEGKLVICDRFVTSSIVYQGIARGLGADKIRGINEFALEGLKADFTFMLQIPYKEGLKRKESQKTLDRLENSGNDFHKKVYQGYIQMAENSEEILTIDGGRDINEIHKDIVARIEEVLMVISN